MWVATACHRRHIFPDWTVCQPALYFVLPHGSWGISRFRVEFLWCGYDVLSLTPRSVYASRCWTPSIGRLQGQVLWWLCGPAGSDGWCLPHQVSCWLEPRGMMAQNPAGSLPETKHWRRNLSQRSLCVQPVPLALSAWHHCHDDRHSRGLVQCRSQNWEVCLFPVNVPSV